MPVPLSERRDGKRTQLNKDEENLVAEMIAIDSLDCK